jgi:hypothetical protein
MMPSSLSQMASDDVAINSCLCALMQLECVRAVHI